ncbi:MAG: hypothetical protein NC299_15260 [Lachnospiraceae bacterium]|nr:hypothetical protein [Lachnospiraceae bacterium]
MKKSILAGVLAAVMLLSGCSGVSEESGNSTVESNSSSRTESSGSSTIISSSTSETSEVSISDNKELEEKFNAKCKAVAEQMFSFYENVGYSVELTEPSVQYNNSDDSLFKIYVLKVSNANEDERIAMAFLDTNSTDEYKYFQSVKNFINFLGENALEICGRNQYMLAVNSTESGTTEISVTVNVDKESVDVVYGNRAVRSAYSDRLKSIDILKDCSEQLSLPALLKFDDLPQNCVSYDITNEYQGKSLTHKWYRLDDGQDDHNYVTYIDDGTYDDMTDEELIYYAYSALLDPQNELDRYSNNFYFAYKSGEELACSITYYVSSAFKDWSSCRWLGDYEDLNSNLLNTGLLNVLQGKAEQ